MIKKFFTLILLSLIDRDYLIHKFNIASKNEIKGQIKLNAQILYYIKELQNKIN